MTSPFNAVSLIVEEPGPQPPREGLRALLGAVVREEGRRGPGPGPEGVRRPGAEDGTPIDYSFGVRLVAAEITPFVHP